PPWDTNSSEFQRLKNNEFLGRSDSTEPLGSQIAAKSAFSADALNTNCSWENDFPSMTATFERRPATEEISGVIERVTFHNDESGFCVLRVKARGQREETTVVGSLPSVTAGEWLSAEGWWVRDKEHGLQFKATTMKTVPPTTVEGIERYLGSGLVKGIGPIL